METKKSINAKKLAASIAMPLIVGFIGALFTTPAIAPWYASLNKPAFSPPNWIFGPAWTLLYLLMGASFYIIWQKGLSKKSAFLFGTQLFLNLLWSIIFFGMKSPPYAFAGIMLLWAAIALTIIEFRKTSASAAFLLIPYVLWVSFAAILNYYIMILNP